MGQKTGIQWCDDTVNPTTGCDGCELWELLAAKMTLERRAALVRSCYAGALHEGRLAKTLPQLYAPNFTEVRMVPGRMATAAAASDLRGTPRPGKPWIPPAMPRLIFVGDMGDLFSQTVTFEFLKEELIGAADSKAGRRHLWLVLTKRPGRFARFAEWAGGLPENIWAGTSITSNRSMTRVLDLMEVDSPRFLSVEPLVESVNMAVFLGLVRDGDHWAKRADLCRDHWKPPVSLMIVGGESSQPGHHARPFNIQWPRDLRDQCRAAGVPFFLKQLGSEVVWDGVVRPSDRGVSSGWPASTGHGPWIKGGFHVDLRDSHGGDWSEWPEDLRIREFPRVSTGA